MRRRCGMLLVVASLLPALAGAEVLCRARNGRVALRAACKKRETSLDLPKGATGDPGIGAGVPVRVVDSAGLPVGAFAEPGMEDSPVLAAFDLGSRVVLVQVNADGFPSNDGRLYHLAAHCADAPLVLSSERPLLRTAVVVGPTAYFADDPIEMRTVVAFERAPGTGCGVAETLPNGNCCEVTNNVLPAGPATKAFDTASLGLTPPFHLEP